MSTDQREALSGALGGGTALLVASALGNGLNYGTSLYLARALGPTGFGLYSLGVTLFNTAMLVGLLGLDKGIVKFVSHAHGTGDRATARAAALQCLIVVLCATVLIGLASAASARVLANTVFHKPGLFPVLLILACALPIAGMGTLTLGALRGARSMRHTVLLKFGWEPIGRLGFSALAIALGLGVAGAAGALAVTFSVTLVIAGRAANRLLRVKGSEARPVWHPGDLGGLFRLSLPLTISTIASVVSSRSDVVILGYARAATEVAIYASAFQTAATLSLVLSAFDTALVPQMGRLVAIGDRQTLTGFYKDAAYLTLVGTLPAFLIVAVFAREILALFGPAYASGAAVLVVLAVGQFVNGATGSAGALLWLAGRERIMAINTVVFGALFIGCGAFLIPRFGMMGAAWTAGANLGFLNLLRVYQVYRFFGMQPYDWQWTRPLVGGCLLLAAFAAQLRFLPGSLHAITAVATLLMYSVGAYYWMLNDGQRGALLGLFARFRRPSPA